MAGFDAIEFIEKTKRGDALTADSVRDFVQAFMEGHVSDPQAAAWMMAVCLTGMPDDGAVALTKAMLESGAQIDLSSLEHTADKHSTGGVGDNVSLVACPLAAAAGATVAKMSGRGLGHTGGTIDKLESIPGFRTALTPRDFTTQARNIGLVIATQAVDLAPADKRFYALRHQTATVDSITLIAASIMSKKLAAGASAIVLDVKCGRGAFMHTHEEARHLARLLLALGRAHDRAMAAAVTPMSQPLGRAVGSSVEVREAIETLSGSGPEDLLTLSIATAAKMLELCGAAATADAARAAIEEALANGAGLAKLQAMIKAQGGDPRVVDNPSRLPRAEHVELLRAPVAGRVTAVNPLRISEAVDALGGSRRRGRQAIEHGAGVVLLRKEGDEITGSGEPLAEIHAPSRATLEEARTLVGMAIRIGDTSAPPPPPFEIEWVE